MANNESTIAEPTKIILEDAGYHVITGENGPEAVQKNLAEMPDLIILDTVMAGMGGLEGCRFLKSQAKTKSIPVIMFTVLGRDSDRRLAEDSGCDGHFVK